MPVYDSNGNDLNGIVYDAEGNLLIQAYDAEGNELIYQRYSLVVNTDDSTGTDSGYLLSSAENENTYVCRSVKDFLAESATSSLQSFIYNHDNGLYYKFDASTTVKVYDSTMTLVDTITLPSGAGHNNDGCYIDGLIYMTGGYYGCTIAEGKSLYIWDVSNNTVSNVPVSGIASPTNGSMRHITGVCAKDSNTLLLTCEDVVSYDIADAINHNVGDKLTVYSYNMTTGVAELLAEYPWDCVFIQGATLLNGILYIACNTQTTGSPSNYLGITLKSIRTDTWEMVDELTVSGNFEPEGLDIVPVNSENQLMMGIGKYRTISLAVRFTPPYKLVKSYTGNSLSILGDSISTYAGYIPSGNAVYYTGSNCGVTSVNQTWWKRVIDTLGMTLNLNNSWSGSRVSTTNGTESAGVTRASNLGTNPNVIIVYMGINDFNNEVATATFRSAYGTMLDNIKNAYPNAELYCSTLPVCERNGATGDPEINDDGVYLSEYNQIITEVATAKGADILDLANCGITYTTLSTYMGDWESATGKALHPNADGMALIAQKAIVDLHR